MNEKGEPAPAPPSTPTIEPEALPRPTIEKRRWPIALIWAVPVLALIISGWYYRQHLLERGGAPITLQVADVTGIKIDETPISHRGVPIGKVTSLQLSGDSRHVFVSARLQRGMEAFAKRGATYWIVRPEISSQSVNGLTTLFSGPYIEADPGEGLAQSEFSVLPSKPIAMGDGVRFVLHAPRRGSLQEGSPIYYHGIQVGVVERVQLSQDAASVNVAIFIRRRYARIVRSDSVFWVVGGADIQGGLLTGVRIRVESLRSLLAGGVAFATPAGDFGPPASEGDHFPLNEEPRKEWLSWSPRIPLPPTTSDADPEF